MPQFTPVPDGALDQWTLVLGFLMPLIVAMVNQSHWPTRFKAIVGLAVCVAAAAVQMGLKGQLDASNLLSASLALAALSITFFKGFWRPTGIAGALESATNLTPTPDAPDEIAAEGEYTQ